MITTWLRGLRSRPGARVARVKISAEVLMELLLAPEGFEVTSALWDPAHRTIDLFVSHPALEALPEGAEPQELTPFYTGTETTEADWGTLKLTRRGQV